MEGRVQSETKRIWIMNVASHNPIGSARQPKASANQPNDLPISCHDETSQLSSAEQGRGECDAGNPRSSRAFNGDCADLVHELANTTTAVLMNAQVLAWKLPPYSHLKRPLREIERNAHRGGELMKRLLSRLAPAKDTDTKDTKDTDRKDTTGQESEPSLWVQGPGVELNDTVTVQEPGVNSGNAENLPPRMNSRPAPGFSSASEVELTSPCDGCTSTFPKKG
jgi:hypothetical protein